MTIVHDTTLITPAGGAVRTVRRASLVFDAGRVVERGPAADYQPRVAGGQFAQVIPGRRHVVIPGLVNTHHHLFQTLTRCLPAVQNRRLFGWLRGLYQHWRELDHQAVNIAAQVSIAELLLHGCTTTSDHFYMFPRGRDVRVEAVLEAAEELGIRIHLCRGAMTLGESDGGLPPDDCVEGEAEALADCQRVIECYHDPGEYALRRIDLGPCSPFNCTPALLRDTQALAREHGGVLLHTHLCETLDEERYCARRYGRRPLELLAELGFLGADVYLAHCAHLNAEEIALLARTRTGVSHCPTSNMRLGSGIAPLRRLLQAGVRVGLGVDGSSSNDGGNLLGEARQALLAARVRRALNERVEAPGGRATAGSRDPGSEQAAPDREPAAGAPVAPGPQPDQGPLFPVAEAFKLATVGGAACLNRPVLGHLNPGAAADFAMFRNDDLALAGALAHDPLAALLLCDAPRAERVFVAGREVVRDARIVAVDEAKLADRMNELVAGRFRTP